MKKLVPWVANSEKEKKGKLVYVRYKAMLQSHSNKNFLN